MAQIQVNLKGTIREYEAGTTIAEIAKSIGMGLYKAACVGKVNGKAMDLRTQLTTDCELEILTFDTDDGKKAYWHTSSHIMAQAIVRLFPTAKLATGPAIDNGFFYDFDLPASLSSEDLERIEAEMKKIIKEDLPIERFLLPPEQAVARMEAAGQDYKIELIQEHAGKGEDISFYRQGDFMDLCAGPHLMSTGKVKAFKLTNCTGAYWRADAKNKMLQRIYGISFPKTSELDAYLVRMEEAKKRDHRKLGKELDLFAIMEEGPGFPFFFPKGMVLRNQLLDFWREVHRNWEYEEISTPMILNEELWHRSGHWDHYQENMYFTNIDESAYAIKPMNCPGGMLAYKRKLWSYRDLPLRVAELGLVHRHELSGTLHGLMRARCFTQDDAHIFMTQEQIEGEVGGVIELIDSVYKVFGFTYHVELSTCPADFIGSEAMRHLSEDTLKRVLEKRNMDYIVNEGDGAFYGPKIDFHLEDSIGRTWQCGTIQLDYQMPALFDLTYTGADGQKHRPVMIHRVAFGSIERFIGILTEHYAGAFPLWLSPVQVKVLPISEKQQEYAKTVYENFKKAGIRAEIDLASEKIGYKIRAAQMEKVPYMVVVGAKEEENGTLSVRNRKEGDRGTFSFADLLAALRIEIEEKRN